MATSKRNPSLPSYGFSGQVDHPFGAINDDGSVNRPLLWKQASKRARFQMQRGFRDLYGKLIVRSYREVFADAVQHYRAEISARLYSFNEDQKYEAELEKGGIDADIARLKRSILIADNAVFPDRDRLAKMRLKLRLLKSLRIELNRVGAAA